jgi:hypothetical protein
VKRGGVGRFGKDKDGSEEAGRSGEGRGDWSLGRSALAASSGLRGCLLRLTTGEMERRGVGWL